MSNDNNRLKYAAFISYNSNDDKTARWLQRRLENYYLPAVIRADKDKSKNSKFKIFRYVSDLNATDLNVALPKELDNSKFLIIICSPHSAKSYWVGKEIRHFIDTGRKDKIIAFVADGIPYSNDENECYNPQLKEAFPNGNLLGISVNDYGDDLRILRKRKTIAKIISILIEMPDAFSFIWNRYKIRRITTLILRFLLTLILSLAFIFSIAYTRQKEKAFEMQINLKETVEYNNLPDIENIVISASLNDEKNPRTDTVENLKNLSKFQNIPGRMKGKYARILISHPDCFPIDTQILIQEKINLLIRRNPARYGVIKTIVIDENGNRLRDKTVEIERIRHLTSGDGELNCTIPLEKQKDKYEIRHKNLNGIILMPCIGTNCVYLK